MTGLYGHKFTSQFGEQVDVSGVWWATLRDLSDQQFKNGLCALRDNSIEWPPNAIEFRKLCLTPQGLLTAIEAQRQFIQYLQLPDHRKKPRKLNPEVYHAYREYCDPVGIKTASEKDVRAMFDTAYKLTLHHVLHGGELTHPSIAIEHKKNDTPAPAEVAKQNIDKLKNMFL